MPSYPQPPNGFASVYGQTNLYDRLGGVPYPNSGFNKNNIGWSTNNASNILHSQTIDLTAFNHKIDNNPQQQHSINYPCTTASSVVTPRFCHICQLSEDMDIDGAPVPPPQEYSDPNPSESSMNFDYLSSLNAGTSRMDASSYNSIPGMSNYHVSPSSSEYGHGHVDESKVIERSLYLS